MYAKKKNRNQGKIERIEETTFKKEGDFFSALKEVIIGRVLLQEKHKYQMIHQPKTYDEI